MSRTARPSSWPGTPGHPPPDELDLRRLWLKGLITAYRTPTPTSLTPDGQRVAIFYTKLHNRLLRPLLAAHDPPAPLPLRHALRVINHHVNDYVCEARMAA